MALSLPGHDAPSVAAARLCWGHATLVMGRRRGMHAFLLSLIRVARVAATWHPSRLQFFLSF